MSGVCGLLLFATLARVRRRRFVSLLDVEADAEAILPKKLPFSRPPKSGAGITGDISLLTDMVRRLDISSDEVCRELIEEAKSSPFNVVEGERNPTRLAASASIEPLHIPRERT